MRRTSRLGILAIVAAFAFLRVADIGVGASDPVIGSAISAVRATEQSARATEPVRYDDRSLVLLASYPMRNGDEVVVAERHAPLWQLVRSTLPDEAVGRIRQLNVVTDGRDATLAMVHRSSIDPSTWVLSLDPSEDEDVIVSTLVHEYAHMLTMRSDDLRSAAASRSGCDGVRMEIGCARVGSALADWHGAFWTGVDEPASTDGRFVSEYAATSVHEDLAESFLAWVLDEVDDPSPGVQARFDLLASRPELVAARDAVRAKLGR